MLGFSINTQTCMSTVVLYRPVGCAWGGGEGFDQTPIGLGAYKNTRCLNSISERNSMLR